MRTRVSGEFEPKYQVAVPIRQLPDGGWMTEIVLIESGETAEYRLSQLLNDPQAVFCFLSRSISSSPIPESRSTAKLLVAMQTLHVEKWFLNYARC